MKPRSFPLLAVLLLCLVAAEASSQQLPRELSGTWVQPRMNETGAMFVRVNEYKEKEVFGVLEIRDSKDCPQPVAFRGMIEHDRVLIKSTEELVCGYRGFLVGEVRKGESGTFVGNYAYLYPFLRTTLTFASGTFVLEPVPQK